jgi:hypothetical protein
MSQISDAVDNAGANATDDRVLGYAVVATSSHLYDRAHAALEAGGTAEDAVRVALADGVILAWAAQGEVAADGAAMLDTSYRGHAVFSRDTERGRAVLGTLRLADELPFDPSDEAAFTRSLEACANVSIEDVAKGIGVDALLGADVEARIARLETPTHAAVMTAEGEAVIVVDRIGNVAIATTGPVPLIVDRSGKPWLVAAVIGDAVRSAATLLHNAIDRAASLEDVAPRTAGLLLAAISHELYRDAFVDGAIAAARAHAERGDPPPKPPMPARGQNFSVGPAGHDG